MRLACGVLASALASILAVGLAEPLAHAEDTAGEPGRSADVARSDATRTKVPFRVVRVMPQSRQALLFDRNRATHVLAEIGGKLDGYTVEDIDDDTVTLARDGKQIVLAAPPRTNRRRDREAVPVRSGAPRASDAGPTAPVDPYSGPADPYGAPVDASSAPVDPYGDGAIRVVKAPDASTASDGAAPDAGIRVVQAPSSPGPAPITVGEGGIRVATAPDAGTAPPAGATPARGASDPPAPDGSRIPGAAAPSAPTSVRVAEAQGGSGAAPSAPIRVAQAPTAPVSDAPAGAARAPDKAALDARTMADVMTADPRARTRAPRTTTESAPSPSAEVRPVAPAQTRPGATVISRGELDSALGDFAGLAAAIRGSFSASGLAIEGVGDGSIFHRAGLRAGDVVASVDGIRLRSLDDAANLYARASTARAITAQIVRGGKPMTLHVVVQ